MMRFPLALAMLLGFVPVCAEVPDSKMIYGLHEMVHIRELGITVPAKLDTGAETASLSARHIKTFECDGVEMVEFDLAVSRDDREEWGIAVEQWDDVVMPLAGYVRIKRRAENLHDGERDFSRRPVVELTVCMGQRREAIDVNLTDRSEFRYPLLMGSQALQRLGALVDPSLSLSVGQPGCRDATDETVTREAAKAH